MKQTVTRQDVSLAIAELMPNIVRGVQLDFFVKHGVTQTQFLLIMAIQAYRRCTMSTLARNLHVSMPTTTGVVARMVRAGYVRRVEDPEDRRQVVVELTPKAQRFIQDFQTVIRRRWEEVLQSLGSSELQTFYAVLTRLRTHLHQLS